MPIRLGVEVMNSKQQLSGIEKLVSLKIEIKIIILLLILEMSHIGAKSCPVK